MAKVVPIPQRTDAQIAAGLKLWRARLVARRAKLAKIRAIRTSLVPRTVVTPAQKRRLLVTWGRLERQAVASIAALNAEKRRRATLTLGERALVPARTLVGIMERGGNNRGTQVLAIIREAGGSGPEPWCGDFVAVCYKRAGSKVVQRSWAAVRLLGYLTGMVVRGIRAGRAGDILVYTFDHTGLLVGYCDANGRAMVASRATHVKAIEGNTGASGAVSDSATGGDGVYVKVRPISLVRRTVRVLR